MMKPDSDHLFNEDLEQLLESLEDKDSDGEEALDELSFLFEQSSSPAARSGASLGQTPSSLPSERELRELFGGSINWEEAATNDLYFTRRPAPKSEAEDGDDLESRLLENAAVRDSEAIITISNPNFYDSLEDLEAFLEKPTPRAQSPLPDIFESLEALLSESTAVEREAGAEHLQRLESLELATESHPENKFKDLEKLLKESSQVMGGVPASSFSPPARLNNGRPLVSKAFEQTMRVPIKQLDNLSNLIGELVVKRNCLEQEQKDLGLFLDNLLNQVQKLSDVGSWLQDLYERTLLEGALLASRNSRGAIGYGRVKGENQGDSAMTGKQDALDLDQFDNDFHKKAQNIIELIVRVRESASDLQFVVDETDQVMRSLRQVTTQLQEGMTKSRMAPFSETADHLPRAIHDLSLELHKQAKLKVEGGDVLIDQMLLEHLLSPMTHLVNNAIAHGIESPQERMAKGKPALGTISVQAFLQGNQTVITVSDDGAGIDANRVKRKAIKKGLISDREAQHLSPQEVYELLFRPGFSTKDQADGISGRGVGLDVVRTSVIDVRGTVTIDSVLGKGTTFTIRLPLTLSICKALFCVSDRARIGFSRDEVEEVLLPKSLEVKVGKVEEVKEVKMSFYQPRDIQMDMDGRRCVFWQNTLLPFQPLSELLSYNRRVGRGSFYTGKQEEDSFSIVILRGGNNLLAVQVDQVIMSEDRFRSSLPEIVIKQIEGPIPKTVGIAGATVLGDGTVMPIGDVLELIDIAQGRLRTDKGSPWRQPAPPVEVGTGQKSETMVLIVDDSITVRELLSLTFSKAGYRVEQARDGQEAWEKLRGGLPCDIVFSDIEMPRLNGLELLSNLQKDPRLAAIPVAFLTSRGADLHRKEAAKLGASGYFTKPCPDRDLLSAAEKMIAGEVLLADSIKAARNQPLSSPLVLIVDDSVIMREMLTISFVKAGYRIEQARDGLEAWEKLRAGLACDLILCDIEMPRLNGLELLSCLQEDEQLQGIPVAMVTAQGAQKMQHLAAAKGAKGFFVKPYIESVLLSAAQRLIAGEVLIQKESLVD
ncbi:MAG: hybrid sensor histidine kinase/response regulator [Microcystis wesenbergii TW10]|jgi:chemotaxis protein histidine kinase CheA/DNA-binding response OmpR family regulator|uniref:histidine kinase n=1 Tax=Microcystis wesenbergii TW10 TaxID=2060474 RepID=A0A3E0LKW1_9CHRO|nr:MULTISPECIES: hybrid sensor histidine kinase/response regulator [Microcystis]MBD2116067.1 hybrid sensor histidine kinase/response regulator [Microcystis wesenbergii FACHB-1339]MCZ8039289.1 hybrid sensor histidine kinase/response regulator [Microcystis sp. LE17-20A]MCZ8210403.1 hybrid sensor histidine kinase/response regulator [Microcystis sp. LE19-8.1F]REJ47927.1 MAG: hybrid sensor histidine kinase/response regulator [Microcystis wesenbergii TW10]